MEDLLLTYNIVHCVPPHTIQQEHQFGSASITDLAKLCRKVMLDYLLDSSQNIGRLNKTVEIDENKLIRRKYNRGQIERTVGVRC
jgi:hypothetical protein